MPQTIKEKIVEITTEMMATSPNRNWDSEALSTGIEKAKMRNKELWKQ